MQIHAFAGYGNLEYLELSSASETLGGLKVLKKVARASIRSPAKHSYLPYHSEQVFFRLDFHYFRSVSLAEAPECLLRP